MSSLSSLRLSPQDEADLRWFWTESEGHLGLKSSFAAQVTNIQLGARRGTWTPIQREPAGALVAAAARARQVSRVLEAVDRQHVLVLLAAYGEAAHPQLQAAYGELAELVTRTTAARQAHRRSRTTRPLSDWLQRLARRADKGELGPRRMVADIRAEAEGRLVAAARAYTDARRRQRRRCG